MTSRLVMTKKDPRQTDFILAGDAVSHRGLRSGLVAHPTPVYSSDTTHYTYPRNGSRATTTITRTDPTGDSFQVGIIEWPFHPRDHVQLVVGTRIVRMAKVGIYTSYVPPNIYVGTLFELDSGIDDSPERFTAADGHTYEWQIHDARPQLVPLRTRSPASTAYVATFVQSHTGLCFRRKYSSSLFIPPEGFHILDDIVVTFIYFESKWRDKEGTKSRLSITMSSPV